MNRSNSMPRRVVLICMLISAAISIAWGYSIEASEVDGLVDFRAIYFGARTVIEHRNPYSPSDFLQIYRQEGGAIPADPGRQNSFFRAIPVCVNLPSTLLLVWPLAQLSWGPAHLIWMVLMAGGLILAAWLVWDLAGNGAPKLTLILLCVFLANCELILQLGNASGIAVGLGVTAVWCLIKRRHELTGVFLLAVALALKPQEIGFIWLCFLLVGGVQRRRALQSMAIAMALGSVSVAWVANIAPNWVQDWHSNVAATTRHGDLSDPGPTSSGNNGPGMIVSLQAVISCFRDDPQVYAPLAYLLGGSLILLWAAAAVRTRGSMKGMWLAIASAAPLGLLPVYHRHYDCKLLLLMIPAVAVMRSEMPLLAWRWTAAVTAAAIVLCADIPVAMLFMVEKGLHIRPDHLGGQILTVLLGRTPTVGLLLCGGFYLYFLMRHAWSRKPNWQRAPGTFEAAGLPASSEV